MYGDSLLFLIKVNKPKVAGKPSMPEIRDTVIMALKDLYQAHGFRAVVEIDAMMLVEDYGRKLG